jgi:hypothetical protein
LRCIQPFRSWAKKLREPVGFAGGSVFGRYWHMEPTFWNVYSVALVRESEKTAKKCFTVAGGSIAAKATGRTSPLTHSPGEGKRDDLPDLGWQGRQQEAQYNNEMK